MRDKTRERDRKTDRERERERERVRERERERESQKSKIYCVQRGGESNRYAINQSLHVSRTIEKCTNKIVQSVWL